MQAKATKKSAETPRAPEKLIGYARVSTTDQDLTVQREALRRAGVGVIFEEQASGTKREGRTELQKVLSVLGKGDALVVTRLDRLGRSLRDLANIAHEIEAAIAALFVTISLESYGERRTRMIIDLDATHDPIHGEQVGRHFHGYHDCDCYLPPYILWHWTQPWGRGPRGIARSSAPSRLVGSRPEHCSKRFADHRKGKAKRIMSWPQKPGAPRTARALPARHVAKPSARPVPPPWPAKFPYSTLAG